VHVTAEAAELGDDDGHLEPPGMGEGSCELGPAIERVVALAGFNLDILGLDLRALALGEGRDGGALGFEPQAAFPLPAGADPQIGDKRLWLVRHLVPSPRLPSGVNMSGRSRTMGTEWPHLVPSFRDFVATLAP
jgi:hypothetical protein